MDTSAMTCFCSVTLLYQVISVFGFSGYGVSMAANNYALKEFLYLEGKDCLKDITPIKNLTLDMSFTPDQEKLVLLDIYRATNGHNWYNQSGWNTPNDTSHCYWLGISCHSNTSYVKSIVLAYNNLDGFLPEHLWKLRNLLSLCIPGNPKVYGRMEDFLFANLSKIQIMIINGASIDGRIPESMGNLTLLQKFFANGMKGQGLSGNLPKNIGNMKELWLMCISGNSFTGEIPRSIKQLKNLRYFELRNSPGKMWGYIDDLLSIPSLKELYLSGVQVIGYLPKSLPIDITKLVLPGNNLHGTLPKHYPKGFRILDVSNNKLTGDIPKDIFLLQHINKIDVSQNLFSSVNNGKPWRSGNRSSSGLNFLSLAGNKNLTIEFQSFIDVIIPPAFNLNVVNISYCGIKSQFPIQFFFKTSIVIIDARDNKFYGRIPDIFTENSCLTYLDVSRNNLCEGLPPGIASFASIQYLDISGNSAMRQSTQKTRNVLLPNFSMMRRTHFGENFTCPEGRLTFNNGRVRLDPAFYRYKYCLCDEEFYGDSGLCKKCMLGGTCQKPVVMTTSDLRPNTMTINAGYWPSPTADHVIHLVRCPVPKACNPKGNCNCLLQTISNVTAKYPNQSVSSLITKCNKSCICHEGNTDRFCSRCQKRFYKSGGLCYPCPKAKDNLAFYIAIPIFALTVLVMVWSFFHFKKAPKTAFVIVATEFLLMLVFTLLEMMPEWVFKLDVIIFVLCMTSRGQVAQSLIKIGVFYLQTLDSMVSTVDVWPPEVFAVQHYVSKLWNLHFPSLSCEFSILFSPLAKFAFVLLLPLFCLLFIGSYFVISIAFNKYQHQTSRNVSIRFKCRQLTMTCLNFAYFPIVETTVSVLRPCDQDHGIRFMPATPWIDCNSQTHYVLSLMGWLSVVVYVIGFPIILFVLMAVFFRKRPSMSAEEKLDMDSWLGSVYLPYKPKYQLYFELILVVRRLLLAIVLSVLASQGSLQTFIVCLILMVSANIQFRLQPYQTSKNHYPFENAFEFVILFVLSMSFMVLRFAALGSSFTILFVSFVMIVNGCVLAGLVACILYLLGLKIPKCRGRERIDVNEQCAILDNLVVNDEEIPWRRH